MNEGIRCAQKVSKISVITLLSIGIVELLIGQISGSVVATADGIDSLSDAMISFIEFMGLVVAGRPADKKFHFRYYKAESFAALIAAIGMIVMGSIILYHSSGSLLLQHKQEIHQPVLTMIVLAAASIISLYRAVQMLPRNIFHESLSDTPNVCFPINNLNFRYPKKNLYYSISYLLAGLFCGDCQVGISSARRE